MQNAVTAGYGIIWNDTKQCVRIYTYLYVFTQADKTKIDRGISLHAN